MIEATRDRDLLERLLRAPAHGGTTWAGYALGDLDDAVFPRTRWLLAPSALALVFLWGEQGATVMLFGDAARFVDLLRAADLPPRFDLHVREVDAPAVVDHLEGPLPPYVRLGLRGDELRDVPAVPGLELRVLGPDDVPAAQALYATYPGNVFDPARVEAGPYLGAWEGERLVAVAGTHVRSARTRVAALGDVVTHPDRRGRGVGAWLTASLCARLLEQADEVVLNVGHANAAGLRAYARVGFGARPEARVPYLEGAGVSLRPAQRLRE